MTLNSMTGYAHAEGAWGDYRWSWELKSVNGKGLDLRPRVPGGMDTVEAEIRKLAAKKMSRGSISANLQIESQSRGIVQVDHGALDRLVKSAKKAAKKHGLKKPRIEDLMGLKGVISVEDMALDESEIEAWHAALVEGFAKALDSLVAARGEEGGRMTQILSAAIDEIAALTTRARACDAAMPLAIQKRYSQQIEDLVQGSALAVDRDRIVQEAAFLATKADVREELDRLDAHVEAARQLIADGSPAGRKLDFLAQEFGREANTLCSKAGDTELSRIGLDLKAVIDQMREQIQNVE